MPELPEVETIRLGLSPAITDKEITDVEVLFKKSFDIGLERIAESVVGAVVTDVRRRGKVLIIDLDNSMSLLIHLKMTGQLVLDMHQAQIPNTIRQPADQTPNQAQSQETENLQRIAGGHPTKSLGADLPDNSTRVVFKFGSGARLFFNDQRKFGWIRLVETSKVNSQKFFEKMGPEPLSQEFRISNFESGIKGRKAPIKAILLDQSIVAGLGNIYVDEALHLAKIHPLRQGRTLTATEVERLHTAITTVLEDSLSYGGTSFTNYVNAQGVKGDYLDNARVFKREGQPCRVCGTTIEKIKVAGRGTHVCPNCQKLK